MPSKLTESLTFRVVSVLVLPLGLVACDLWLTVLTLSLQETILWAILLGVLGVVVQLQIEVIQKTQSGEEDLQKEREEHRRERDEYGRRLEGIHTEQLDAIGRSLHSVKERIHTQDKASAMLQSYAQVLEHAIQRSEGRDIEVLFAQRMIKDAESAMTLLAHDHRYQMEVKSPAQQYSSRWIEVLDSLMEAGGEFHTITNAVVWSPDYLGFRGGVSTYLNSQMQTARENHFTVKRLFAVPDEAVLRQRLDLAQSLFQVLDRYEKTTRSASEYMKARVLLLTQAECEEHYERDPTLEIGDLVGAGWSSNFGVWATNRTRTVNLVRYDRDPSARLGWSIEAICFLCNEQVAKLCSDYFAARWADDVSLDLVEYLGRLRKLIALPSAGSPTPALDVDRLKVHEIIPTVHGQAAERLPRLDHGREAVPEQGQPQSQGEV